MVLLVGVSFKYCLYILQIYKSRSFYYGPGIWQGSRDFMDSFLDTFVIVIRVNVIPVSSRHFDNVLVRFKDIRTKDSI